MLDLGECPLILGKKEEITDRRKGGKASKTKPATPPPLFPPPPPPPLVQGLDLLLERYKKLDFFRLTRLELLIYYTKYRRHTDPNGGYDQNE